MIPSIETLIVLVVAATTLALLLLSIYSIGPTQVGLVRKRFGAKLPGDNPLAFLGEAGYQAEMLMPGLRFKFFLSCAVTKHPWVHHRRCLGAPRSVQAGVRRFCRPEGFH